jgi:hypothetical protein
MNMRRGSNFWRGERQTFAQEVASTRLALRAAAVPDLMLPAQLLPSPAATPFQRLALAVAEAALRDARSPKHRPEVRAWILDDSSAAFSLAYVCEVLSLDVACARNALLARIGGR